MSIPKSILSGVAPPTALVALFCGFSTDGQCKRWRIRAFGVWSLDTNEPPMDRGTEYRFGEV